ncbi:MAG TPA: glycoside hydrolase family 3 N-terminal domain-containing protein [Candidatus Acidoferrales bacterium]|nr:glycoside hydrolase family 3 N-terminal domain-containing protein [Candidatus Acidoferrales bacterium]
MMLEEKLGQLVTVNFWGRLTSVESFEYKELLRLVREKHVGGIMVQARRTPTGIERSQAYPTAALANELQQVAKIPLLVAADFENGTAMRLSDGTAFPTAMAVAATGDAHNAYTVGKITALEALAAGVNWVFAPVADVNANPENPIINTRSFGEDPQRIAEFVAQYVRGVQENGALATAKHFPGHGDVSVDSHLALPVVPHRLDELNKIDLFPFRAAIDVGVATIMSGHLAVSALEPEGDVPATVSRRVLTNVLRKDLRFAGIAVTDALDMGGITKIGSSAEIAARAIAAGIDMLLIPPNPDAAIEGLRRAVESGELPLGRVDEAVRRILRGKLRLNLDKRRMVDLNQLSAAIGRPEYKAAAQEIADRGITLLRDGQRLLPLDARRALRALLIVISVDPDPYPGALIESELRERVSELQVMRADAKYALAGTAQLPSAETYDVVIVAVFVRVADRKGSVDLPMAQVALIDKVLSTGKSSIVACFGSPYVVGHFANVKTWIAGFGTQDVVQRAMVRAMFGQIDIRGKVPVRIPGVAKPGDGMELAANPMRLECAGAAIDTQLKPAFDILKRATEERAFPGGVLAVGHQGKLLVHPFGKLTYDKKAAKVSTQTVYDLASLTKPVVTTSAVMVLTAKGLLDIHAPISRYLNEWRNGPDVKLREKVTVRDLLLHTSGLPAHREFYRTAKGSQDVLKLVCMEPLIAEPGTRIEYSDLGFMLLGKIVERISGKTLDQLANERIFTPLGMEHSWFSPPRNLRLQIAPTEDDAAFRKRHLRGEVDDANAFAMGGVAGHAGLFSTAQDLSIFAQMMLNGGVYAHRRVFPRAIASEFTRRVHVGNSARALGWDVPTENSSSGLYFSPQSYGHNGFTGTSIWIDPQKELFVILLTNRVHPFASNDKIREVRPALHNAVLEALVLAAKEK